MSERNLRGSAAPECLDMLPPVVLPASPGLVSALRAEADRLRARVAELEEVIACLRGEVAHG